MRRAIMMMVGGLLLASAGIATAQTSEYPVTFDKRNLNGPRFGMTYIAGDGELYQQLEKNDMGRMVSQFGWHFELQVIPEGGGPQFVVEFVPMLAAVEYGMFIPNFTLAMGVRMPGGWEFGMGPNFFLSRDDNDDVRMRTSLLVAVGRSFRYGGVSIPINLAAATAPEGNRFSLIFGYAIGKTTKDPLAQGTLPSERMTAAH
jgi:hypothetical protein